MEDKKIAPLIKQNDEKKAVRWWQSVANFFSKLYACWGPHLPGTRNWLLFTMLVLLSIVLLGGFAYVPLAAAFTVAGATALMLTLKIGAFIGFALGLTMGITAIVNDYYQRENGNRNYFWWPYLKDLWHENFVLSNRRTANFIKLGIGILLFALVVALLICTSGIGLAIPVVTAVVNFTATAFATTGIFAGASWFTALFLAVLAMTFYDVLFDAIEPCSGVGNYHRIIKEQKSKEDSSAASYVKVSQKTNSLDVSHPNKEQVVKGKSTWSPSCFSDLPDDSADAASLKLINPSSHPVNLEEDEYSDSEAKNCIP